MSRLALLALASASLLGQQNGEPTQPPAQNSPSSQNLQQQLAQITAQLNAMERKLDTIGKQIALIENSTMWYAPPPPKTVGQ